MNEEEEEFATDAQWAEREGDRLMVERGFPLADIVEEDNA